MADTTKQAADQSFFIFVKDTNTGKVRRLAIPADVQIGLQGNPAELQLLGRLSLAATDYSITAANQGVLYVANNDTIISVSLVDTPSSGRITLYLPANPRNGQLHFIKDMSGTADSVPIDVVPSPGAKIDQYNSRTLTDKFGSIALYWFGDRWRILVSGLGLVGIGAADGAATYVTLSGNATLTNERRLNVSGSNLTMNDLGPNATVNLDLSQILGAGAGTFTYATVTADAYGRITAISAGAAPSPANASYITVTNEPGLSGERALVAGTGILLQDGGSNTGITASINNNVVATLTGSIFTGPLSGSLQRTSAGLSFLVAGPGITIFTQSNGQVVIGSPWTDASSSLMTTSSVSHDGQGRFVSAIGQDVYFFVSGTIGIPSGSANARRVSVFGGDVRVSGSLTVGTGSVTVTSNDIQFGEGARIERSGNQLKFIDASNPSGQVLSDLVGGGSGGPVAAVNLTASYVDFVPAQSGQTMIRWKFDNQNLVGNNTYLNTGVSSSVRLALTASVPNNIRTGQSGVFGESVGFSHVYFSANEPEAKIVGDKITVSTWIRPVITGSGWKHVIAKEYSSGSWVSPFAPVSMFQYTADNALIEFGVTTGAGSRTVVNSDTNTALKLKGEQWNHVVLVYNGAFILGYINGVEVARASKTGSIDYGTTPGGWNIGATAATLADQFSGSIDDIRIEAVAWTPDQIREHYETGLFRAYVTGSRGIVSHVSGNAIPDAPVAVTTVQTISYTGTTASFIVPDGITELDVKMWGAGAGNGAWASNQTAGAGGYASGRITVTPGEQLFIIVGGGGQGTTGSAGDGGPGGWGGGGFGTKGDASGGGGGGYTGIFSGAIHQHTAIMIAGGGGAGTGFRTGGGGGGTTGASVDNGTGGTQTAGGSAGGGGGVTSGGPLYGGPGAGSRTVSTGNDDGGGGGGYFGGGGGSGDGRGGGGGSGFLHPSRVTNGTLTQGESGNGSNTRANPPNTLDSDYLSLAPTNTGKGGNTVGGNGTDGGHGFIVIRYTVGGQQAYWLEDTANTAYITSSVAIGTTGSAQSAAGQEAFFFVSGTIDVSGSQAKKALFGGDVQISGTLQMGAFSPGSIFKLTTPPASGTWTNVSLGTSRFEVQRNGALFLSSSAGSSPDFKVAARSAPTTPYKITACIAPLFHPGTNSSVVGVGWRDSSNGRLATWLTYAMSSGIRFGYNKYNSPTSFNSSYFDVAGFFTPWLFMRLEDDGTNRRVGYSMDGENFMFFGSTSRTDFLTPDQVCILTNPETIPAAMTVLSWKVG